MDFKMDVNGDIAVENGDFVFVEGVDATVQFLIQSLRLFLAEWFLDETQGFPYFDKVFIKNPNPSELATLFKVYIVKLPGILELQSFDLTFNSPLRLLSVSGRIRALDGEADFSLTTNLPGSV